MRIIQKTDYINIHGNTIYYESYSTDTPKSTIVMLHGFLSSAFSFRRIIPYLHENYHVVTIDLPPFGKSGKSNKFLYSYKQMAKAVIAVIEHLNIQRCILAGHSMGGQIVLNIIRQKPELAAYALLLCSSAYLPKSNKSLIYSSYIPFFHLYVKRHLAKSGLEANLQNVVYDKTLIDEDMRKGYLDPFMDNDIFKALRKMIRDREGDLPRQEIQRVNTPCLLIWGENDKVVPLSKGKQLAADLPNAKLVILKETGHLVPEERPAEIVHAMKQFEEEMTLQMEN